MNTLAMNGVDLGHMNDGGSIIVAIIPLAIFFLTIILVATMTGDLITGLTSGIMAGAISLFPVVMLTSSSFSAGQETAVSDFESHYGIKLMSNDENGDIRSFDSSDTVFDQDNEYKRVTFEDNGSLYEGYVVFVEEGERGSKVFALAVDTSEEGRNLVEYDGDADMETQESSRELEEAEASA